MSLSSAPAQQSKGMGGYARLLPGLMGLWLGLALLKWGTPVIFEGLLPPPANLTEVVYFGWPASWGWWGTAAIGLLSIPLLKWPKGVPRWLLLAPAIWLIWQWVASVDSVNREATNLTVLHFTATAGWFALGVAATRGLRSAMWVWFGLGIGLVLVISSGFNQQFGGLEVQREFGEKFLQGELPPDQQQAAEAQGFRKVLESPLGRHKLLSERIYATLFYPNTLAGVLLLLLPGVLAAMQLGFRDASEPMRRLLLALVGLGASACLVWSGSKAGWLIALAMIGFLILRSANIPAARRRWIVIGVVLLGLTGLIGRNLDYFKKGARSVGARTDYWMAANSVFLENPLTGSGPGTFADTYRERKSGDAEMARLAHNDYFQQASDSGAIGFLAYLVFVAGGLGWLYLRLDSHRPLAVMTWLGLAAWAVQSFSEFGLYIPAIAWPAFFLLGLLIREAVNDIDSGQRQG